MTEVLFPVRDIMIRTRENLVYIDHAHRQGEQVWEVTQLVNSFMGALAHPWELMKSELKDLKFSEPDGASWPYLGYEDEADEKAETVGQQLRLVRNAFAHGNIRFISGTHGDIAELQLWNTDSCGCYRTWSCTVDLDTLRALLEKFVETTETSLKRISPRMPSHIKDKPPETGNRCQQCGIDLRAGQLRDQEMRARRQQLHG